MRIAIWMLISVLLGPVAEADALFSVAYHDVRDDVEGQVDVDRYAVSTAELATHFRWLRREGFTVVSIGDVIAARDGGEPLPPKAVLLTFDDGLRSIYTHVWPLLKVFDYPAVVSVVTSWVGTTTPIKYDHRELDATDFLSWSELREMQASGLVEVASHSHNLHHGIRANPGGSEQPAATTREHLGARYENDAGYRGRVQADLALSARILEREIGVAPRVVTWPFGAHNATARDAAAEVGMTISLSLAPRETQLEQVPTLIGRELIVANPDLVRFADFFLDEPAVPTLRAAQVRLDDVYHADPAEQERRLDRLLDRIKALGISHVFLQAFADPDGDGIAGAVYFPNRHLPVRADLFSRTAWQLQTRSNVKVYAWLPVTGFSDSSPDLVSEIYADLGRHASFAGLHFQAPVPRNELAHSDPAPASIQADITAELARVVRLHRPGIRTSRALVLPTSPGQRNVVELATDVAGMLEQHDFVTLILQPGRSQRGWRRKPLADLVEAMTTTRPDALDRVVFHLQTEVRPDRKRVPSPKVRNLLEDLQVLGVRHLAYYPDDFLQDEPRLADLRPGISLAKHLGSD